MHIHFIRTFFFLLAIFAVQNESLANILANESLATPTSPAAPSKRISLAGLKVDSKQPIWVSYSLLAISPSQDSQGAVVIEGSPEGIPVPMADTTIRFATDSMSLLPRSGTFAESFKKQWGERSPQEMKEALGPDLFKCFEALMRNEGNIFGKTVVKTYQTNGESELLFSASVSEVNTLQPALLTVVIGQGDVPEEYKDAFSKYTTSSDHSEKLVTAVILFLIAGFYLVNKFRRRA